MKHKIIIEVTTRDRIERQMTNSILAHASRVHQCGLSHPDTPLARAE